MDIAKRKARFPVFKKGDQMKWSIAKWCAVLLIIAIVFFYAFFVRTPFQIIKTAVSDPDIKAGIKLLTKTVEAIEREWKQWARRRDR